MQNAKNLVNAMNKPNLKKLNLINHRFYCGNCDLCVETDNKTFICCLKRQEVKENDFACEKFMRDGEYK